MRVLLALPALALMAACATGPRLEPEIKTVEVKVKTPVPCEALEKLGPEPNYPDTDAAIAAETNLGKLAKLYAKGRLMRVQRLAEYTVAKASCLF